MSSFQCCYSFGLIRNSAMKLITVVNQNPNCLIFIRVYLLLPEHVKYNKALLKAFSFSLKDKNETLKISIYLILSRLCLF